MTRKIVLSSIIGFLLCSFPFPWAFAGSAQYTYDDQKRLIKIEYNSGAVIQYTYDEVGNRTSKVVSTVPLCEGNFDSDSDVDGSDLAVFAADFGRTDCSGDCEGDFDSDNDVDGSDLAVFAADFGRTDCP